MSWTTFPHEDEPDRKVLVVVMGQMRAAKLTWPSFVKHVLEPLNADLLTFTDEPLVDHTIPYMSLARGYKQYHNYADGQWEGAVDEIARGIHWRPLSKIPGNWLGGAFGRMGSGAILAVLRNWVWEWLHPWKVWYDTIILTRADHMYAANHMLPLRKEDGSVIEGLYVPEGEDYGGVCDRHVMVCGQRLFYPAVDIMSDVFRVPELWKGYMDRTPADMNVEMMVKDSWTRHGIWPLVKRMPRVQYLVTEGKDGTPTRWSTPVWDERVLQWVKYPSEVSLVLQLERERAEMNHE